MAKTRRASGGKSKTLKTTKQNRGKNAGKVEKNKITTAGKAKSRRIKNDSNSNGPAAKKSDTMPTPRKQPLIPLPLDRSTKILLIGEGDFSFSASLATHHGCAQLTATTPDTPASLAQKHPTTSAPNITAITSASPDNKILYSIDGTKLGLPSVPGGSELRRRIGTFDAVWFNFPHVGGRSTDVNRQVRANQALVVGVLEAASRMVRDGGAVVITLFEGMPYELWGVRNLARHVGLRVERRGLFEWERFPGYEHRRTLGNVDGGGGWKGEDRDARIYVFRKGGSELATADVVKKKKKRKRDDSDDDDDDDDDEEGD